MLKVTSREFRANQAQCLHKADSGEQVVITRRGKCSYLLIPVHDDELVLSPSLNEKIRKAREEQKRGMTRKFEDIESMTQWLENL